jgi:hypothetical protein
MANSAPTSLQFGTTQSAYFPDETVNLTNAWVYDANGYSDLQKVDFWLRKDSGSWQDISDTYSFTPWSRDSRWASFNKSLGTLTEGNYDLWAAAYDYSGTYSTYQMTFSVGNVAPTSLSFSTDKTTYNPGETVNLSGWAYDENGMYYASDYHDLDEIDFWLKKDGVWQDINDLGYQDFISWSEDERWASFSSSSDSLGLTLEPGDYMLWGQAYDTSGAASNYNQVSFSVVNSAPTSLSFSTTKSVYHSGESVNLTDAWVYDANSYSDLDHIDFWLKKDGVWQDISDTYSFSPGSGDSRWASFNKSLSGLADGDYDLWAIAYDDWGATSSYYQVSFKVGNIAPTSLSFGTNKTTYNIWETVNIAGGWVYDANGYSDLDQIDFWLKKDDGFWQDISDTYSFSPWSDDSRWASFNKSLTNLSAGNYTLWGQAYDDSGAISNYAQVSFSVVNLAPQSLSFDTTKSVYQVGESISLTNGWVYDANSYFDLNHIDFWLKQDGVWQDISDTYGFSPWSDDSRWASFNKSLTNLNPGNYTLWGKAYDNWGAVSNFYQVNFVVQQTFDDTYENNDTRATAYNLSNNEQTWLSSLSGLGFQTDDDWYRIDITSGYENLVVDLRFTDANGDIDLAVYDAAGNRVTDSRSTTNNEYIDTVLSSSGTYYLKVYYDNAGNTYDLWWDDLPSSSDWFDQHIQDSGVRSVARSRFTDGVIDRNDMIDILRNAKDGSVINSTELTDLRTLISESSYLGMADYVHVLSDKVINGNVANTTSGIGNLYAGSSDTQMENLIGKWFLGNDRPVATSPDGTTTYTYQYASGTLFQNGIDYNDIAQQYVGNCYYMAALAGAAFRSPSTIQSMFIDNGDDTYTVRFYKNGVADYVTVDRYLPTTSWGTAIYANWGGGRYSDSTNELWVALAEKAYAQLNESGWIGQDNTNSYQGISGGWPHEAIEQITARNTSGYLPLEANNSSTVINTFNSGKTVFLNTSDHAYTLVGYNSSTERFTIYNPWGSAHTEELSWNQVANKFVDWSYTTT